MHTVRDHHDLSKRLRACLLGFLLLTGGCKTAGPRSDILAQRVIPPAENASRVAADQAPSASAPPVAPATVTHAPNRPSVQLTSALQDQGAQLPAPSPPSGASDERAPVADQEEVPQGLMAPE